MVLQASAWVSYTRYAAASRKQQESSIRTHRHLADTTCLPPRKQQMLCKLVAFCVQLCDRQVQEEAGKIPPFLG